MKKTALLMMVLLVTLSGSAFGFAFTNQALTNAFGDNPFDHHNNTAPIEYPYSVGYLPSPGNLGEGGEKFDLEGFLITHDQDYLYIAITNSFGENAYSDYWNQSYRMGDIFFGYANDNRQKSFGIDFMTGELYELNGSFNYIPDISGTYYDYTDIRNRVGAHTIGSGAFNTGAVATRTGGLTDLVESDPLFSYESDVYTYEFRISMSDLTGLTGWQEGGDLFFHTNLGCGNDLMETTYNTAIPEPGTIVLLGLGLCAAGFLRKRIM